MVLGVIPARGGSKGIPRKNLHPVAGKPLLVWTVEAAIRSHRIDRAVVSTDDDDIGEVARGCGIEVLRRPAELASDEASTLDVVRHAMEQVPADTVVVLHPTSPIRRKGLIDACVAHFFATQADSLGTVHKDYSYEYGDDMPRRQEIRPRMIDNGNVYVLSADTVRAGRWLGDRLVTMEISREEAIEIDDDFDLWLAEQVLLHRWQDS